MQSGMNTIVPLFALYGEDAWPNALDAMHIETIASRSGLYNWEIAAHRHGDLHQVMWVIKGGGVLLVEDRAEPFETPCLMVLPAGTVHGFTWTPGADGYVLMLHANLLDGLIPAEDHWIWDRIGVMSPPARLIHPIQSVLDGLATDFARAGVGRRAALSGAVLQLSALITRAESQAARAGSPLSPDAQLVARYRLLIETEFCRQPRLETYCAALGVTAARLVRACRSAAGRPPIALAHERTMLEARRALSYTALGVAEVAYSLGFADAAYFSRFFKKREGISPVAFRERLAAP